MTREKCRRMMPRVGDRLMLPPSAVLRTEDKKIRYAPCTVTAAWPEKLMFMVTFDSGLRETYTVQDILILTADRTKAKSK